MLGELVENPRVWAKLWLTDDTALPGLVYSQYHLLPEMHEFEFGSNKNLIIRVSVFL